MQMTNRDSQCIRGVIRRRWLRETEQRRGIELPGAACEVFTGDTVEALEDQVARMGEGLDFVARILAAAPAHLTPNGLLVCEIGENRKALERAYPGTRFRWPQDEVFILPRARMPSAARSASRPRRGA